MKSRGWVAVATALGLSAVACGGRTSIGAADQADASTGTDATVASSLDKCEASAVLEQLAGQDATDCGTVGVDDDGDSQIACALDHRAAGQPFWIRIERHTIELSYFAIHGLALDASGTLYLVGGSDG